MPVEHDAAGPATARRNWRLPAVGRAVARLATLLAVVAPCVIEVGIVQAADTVPEDDFQTIVDGFQFFGNLTSTGNGLLWCGDGCQGENNPNTMTYVDVDDDPDTFNSSSGNLTIPAGATVAKAVLVWQASATNLTARCAGGRPGAPVTAEPADVIANEPLIRVGGAAYQEVGPADYISYDGAPGEAELGFPINGAVDVSAQLAGVGSGTHVVTVANLVSAQGRGCLSGWALHVAYDYGGFDPAIPDSAPREFHMAFGYTAPLNSRNCVTFDGFRTVTQGASFIFTAADGDPATGDQAFIEWDGGSGAVTPPGGGSGNAFTSRIAESISPHSSLGDGRDFTNMSIDTFAATLDEVPAGTESVDACFVTSVDGIFGAAMSMAVPVAAIEIEKTAADGTDGQIVTAGETPVFHIAVTNASGVEVSDVVVDDPNVESCTLDGEPLERSGTSYAVGALAAAETVTLECTGRVSVVGDADYTNTATATGNDPAGEALEPVSDTSEVFVSHISLTKSVDQPRVRVGTEITWTIKVLNDGNTRLRNVSVEDADCDGTLRGPSGPGAALGVLAAGDTWEYTCTEPATRDKTNTASVTAEPFGTVDGDGIVGTNLDSTDDANLEVVSDPPRPAISLDKRAIDIVDVNDNRVNDPDDEILYDFLVVNTGNVVLTGVTVDDELLVERGVGVACPRSTLAPGESMICIADGPYVISDADAGRGTVLNIGVVVGSPTDGGRSTDMDSETTPVEPSPPNSALPNTGGPQWAKVILAWILIGSGAIVLRSRRQSH